MDKKGKVFLVGAGPGDVELLTLKAERLIKEADVVVFDRLVGEKVMDLIPEGCEKIDVGKNVGDHPVPQHEINKILLREALKGKNVVRLKGGDPFVFGRGGEELELLSEEKVDFQVVPGITSSIAAAAYGGIPVTHRDFCSSLHIITGHAKAGAELSIDFPALVRLNGTLVFMMSVANVGAIAKGLMEAGMAKDMPCAIVENGTRLNQRRFVSDLDNIEETVKINQVKSPAVILVGKVCSLADKFTWFDELPLKGKKILITQPQKKASKLEEQLRALGAETKLYPCIKTEYIRPVAVPLEENQILVFTSAEGVHSFFNWLDEAGLDSRALAGKKIACVGPATKKTLKDYGLNCDFMPTEYYGETLGKEMVETGFAGRDTKVLLLRANIGSEEILEILENASIPFTDCKIYKTEYIKHENMPEFSNWDYITFTSKSTVEGFVKSMGQADFEEVKAICIGRKTAEIAAEFNFQTLVSKSATIESMVERIVEDI